MAWLLVFQSAGEALSRGLSLPLPGPVLGMMLMLAGLRLAVVRGPVGECAGFLLSHLSLLFIPVGVGVMTHLALVSQYGGRMLPVIIALVDVDRAWQSRRWCCFWPDREKQTPPEAPAAPPPRGGDTSGPAKPVPRYPGNECEERLNMPRFVELWIYLSATPLFGLTATLVVYLLANAAYTQARRRALGPIRGAVVGDRAGERAAAHACGLPDLLRRRAVHPLPARACRGRAGVAAVAAPRGIARAFRSAWCSHRCWAVSRRPRNGAVAFGWAVGLPHDVVLSLAPKSVTAPVAMGIAEKIGGIPALSAIFAVLTGMIGALSGKYLFDALLNQHDRRAQGYVRAGLRAGHSCARHRRGKGPARQCGCRRVRRTRTGHAGGARGTVDAVGLPPLLSPHEKKPAHAFRMAGFL